MSFGTRRPSEPIVLPLQSAIFCLDCETISNSPHDECHLCRSRSLVSLSRMLGGNLFRRGRNRLPQDQSVRFDVVITLELHDVKATDLNRTLNTIAHATGSTVGNGGARIHVEVEPSTDEPTSLKRAA